MQDNAVQNLRDDSSRTVIKLHHDRLALISVTDAQHRAILKYQRSATGLADTKVAKLELKLKELAVAWQWWDLMGFHFRYLMVSLPTKSGSTSANPLRSACQVVAAEAGSTRRITIKQVGMATTAGPYRACSDVP